MKADVIPGGALSYFLFSLNAIDPTSQLRIPTPLDIKVPQVHDDGHLCTRTGHYQRSFRWDSIFSWKARKKSQLATNWPMSSHQIWTKATHWHGAALMGSTLHIVYTIHDCSLKALFEMQLATTFDKTPKHLQALPWLVKCLDSDIFQWWC